MLRLQIAISNLQPTNYHPQAIESVTLKFGSINTHLPIHQGHGGKTLFLEITPQQMQQIYHLYACGLFIQTSHGRFFSLLSLQKLKVSDRVICHEVVFSNDVRQTKFKCDFSIATNNYRTPKIPDTTKLQDRQKALDMLKKPPIPKNTQHNNFINDKKSFSFLNSKQQKKEPILPDHLKTLKHGLPKQNQIKKNLQKRQKYSTIPKEMMRKEAEMFDDGDFFEDNPPVMEFTNDQIEKAVKFEVPQIGHIDYADSVGQLTRQNQTGSIKSPEQQYPTFNRNGQQVRQKSPQTPSEFQLHKRDSQTLPPKPKTKIFSRQEIKALARQDVQQKDIKNNIMIPVAKEGSFELVPLSSLKPEQIIDFVHQKRSNEEEAHNNQLRKKKLEQQERELNDRNRKLQIALQRSQRQTDRQKQERDSYSHYQKKRNSKELIQSVNELIDQEAEDERSIDEDYESDFESMSLSGSIIRSKSKLSNKSRSVIKGISKQDQSGNLDEDYSQQFDSYSQSMLSKTNPMKNTNKAANASDLSDSFISISVSQSYRK